MSVLTRAVAHTAAAARREVFRVVGGDASYPDGEPELGTRQAAQSCTTAGAAGGLSVRNQ